MGLNIKIKDAIFTKKIDFFVPASENLVGYWTFEGALADGIRNKVTGISGTIIGSPTVSDGKIITNNLNGFLTDISVPGEKTIISISKRDASLATQLIGTHNYASVKLPTTQLSFVRGYPYLQISAQNTVTGTSGSNASLNHFVAGAIGSTSNSLYLSKDGTLFETTANHSLNILDFGYFRIGGVGGTYAPGTAETYAVLVYDKKLSTAEVQTVFDFLKDSLTGITIN